MTTEDNGDIQSIPYLHHFYIGRKRRRRKEKGRSQKLYYSVWEKPYQEHQYKRDKPITKTSYHAGITKRKSYKGMGSDYGIIDW